MAKTVRFSLYLEDDSGTRVYPNTGKTARELLLGMALQPE